MNVVVLLLLLLATVMSILAIRVDVKTYGTTIRPDYDLLREECKEIERVRFFISFLC